MHLVAVVSSLIAVWSGLRLIDEPGVNITSVGWYQTFVFCLAHHTPTRSWIQLSSAGYGILLKKGELIAFKLMSCCHAPISVLCLFLTLSYGDLQYVIVAFPGPYSLKNLIKML